MATTAFQKCTRTIVQSNIDNEAPAITIMGYNSNSEATTIIVQHYIYNVTTVATSTMRRLATALVRYHSSDEATMIFCFNVVVVASPMPFNCSSPWKWFRRCCL